MLTNKDSTNKSPRERVEAVTPGHSQYVSTKNNGELQQSKSRYQRGFELYQQGKVSIAPNGYFKVSGFLVDTEKMQCECLDYKTRKQTCKHIYSALLFVKNRGKQTITHLNGSEDQLTASMNKPETKPVVESKQPSDKPTEAHRKPFDRQATITRLAVLNTATEILKTHSKPIEYGDIVSLAAQLEQWALGGQNL